MVFILADIVNWKNKAEKRFGSRKVALLEVSGLTLPKPVRVLGHLCLFLGGRVARQCC